MNLPPDRSHVATEARHPGSHELDRLDVAGCIDLMIDDHDRVLAALRTARPALVAFIAGVETRACAGGRLIYVGAGTSGRLGVLDAAECPPTFQTDPAQVVGVIAGGDAALRRSSEAREDDPQGAAGELAALRLVARDTVLGIAAGGTTPYVLGAIELAHRAGAATALLTCAPGAPSPAGCDLVIPLETGPELLTGSTRLKAGSATKLALNIITTTLFVQLGKTYGNLMVDLRATNDKLADRALRILVELCPKLDRRGAADALAHAEGHLKTAVVMTRLGVDRADAARRLEAAGGKLRDALDGG